MEKSAALVAGGREAILTNCARRASRSAPYLGCLEQTLVPTNPPAAEKLALAGTPEDGSGRADRILETLLHGIERARATTVIIDITGVQIEPDGEPLV